MGPQRTARGAINRDSDAALVAATRRGETHAFAELVLRHKRRVFAVVQRITKNREDSEDAIQESFHKAFLHLDGFREKSEFSTWLVRIAMNEAFMVLRRKRRAVEVLPGADADMKSLSEAFVDQSPTPEESCRRREYTALLTEAITRLSPTIRRTILLCDIEERSVGETAQILGASISAVKSRLSRGRRELGETVNPPFLLASATRVRVKTFPRSSAELQP